MMDPAQSSATTSNLGGAAAGQAARTKSKAYQTTIAAEAGKRKAFLKIALSSSNLVL